MRNHLQKVIIAGTFSALVASMGCYTIIKHPEVRQQREDQTDYVDQSDHVTFASQCQSCHNSETAWMHTGISIPPPRVDISPSWYYYYETPWWYRYYASRNEAAQSADNKKRPFDRRKLTRPGDNSAGRAPLAAPAPSGGALARPSNSGSGDGEVSKPKDDDSNKRKAKRGKQTKSSRRKKPDNPDN